MVRGSLRFRGDALEIVRTQSLHDEVINLGCDRCRRRRGLRDCAGLRWRHVSQALDITSHALDGQVDEAPQIQVETLLDQYPQDAERRAAQAERILGPCRL